VSVIPGATKLYNDPPEGHTSHPVHRPSVGGMGTVALGLAREQVANHYDASIWCVDSSEVASARATPDLERRIIATSSIGPRAFAISREAERSAAAVPADIVHQHGLWTAQSRVTAAFRTRRIPTVVAPHGSLEPWALRRSRWKKRLALATFEWRNLREASCLHATANTEAESFRQLGLRSPIAILPNGVAESWPRSAGEGRRFRERHGLGVQDRLMLFVSRVHPVKGLPLLIEALVMNRLRLHGWQLIVAGPDCGSHAQEVQALANRSGLEGVVRLVGAIVGQDKRDAFAAADLFVHPSHSENFGIVIAEALGAGVPVLTTHGAPWSELVTRDCGWWVPVASSSIADALADALSRSPSELAAMGARGRQLVTSRYTWPSVVERAGAVYRWLTGETARPDFVMVD